MLLACLPFGPVVTSNETFWPSFSVLNPGMLIAEKCANRSSPPPSGVMNPKPFASLNHFTVPVAISNFPHEQQSNRASPANVSISRKERRCSDCKAVVQGRTYCLETKTLCGGYTRRSASASGFFGGMQAIYRGRDDPGRPQSRGRRAKPGRRSPCNRGSVPLGPASDQRRARGERLELAPRDLAREGNHPAVGAGVEPVDRDVLE